MQATQPDRLSVTPLQPNLYQVQNLDKDTRYEVTVGKGFSQCNCPSRRLCKHITAVQRFREQERMNTQPDNVTPLQPKTTEPMAEILVILKAIASQTPPSWQRSLKAYSTFDWSKIGATVVAKDGHGATKVSWCGHVYVRRAGNNPKYGASIWFSRSAGKGEDDETQYLRLITFKDTADAEPLPEYVARALS